MKKEFDFTKNIKMTIELIDPTDATKTIKVTRTHENVNFHLVNDKTDSEWATAAEQRAFDVYSEATMTAIDELLEQANADEENSFKTVEAFIIESAGFDGWTVMLDEAIKLRDNCMVDDENTVLRQGRVKYNVNDKDDFEIINSNFEINVN